MEPENHFALPARLEASQKIISHFQPGWKLRKKLFHTSSRAGSFTEKFFRLPARLEASQKNFSYFQPGWKLRRKLFRLPAGLEDAEGGI
ncbi:MAG: hypothetical protein LBQ65_07660 [Tannerellaceae bacterium]|jgi:hypothetical protein|nr:hypothetical protein [Tannerellaceae bacterium]